MTSPTASTIVGTPTPNLPTGGGKEPISRRSSSSNNSHVEPHFGAAEVVRDIIIGLSDGLTVPFALAAGLSSLNNTHLVVTAGFAEIVAGSISMGLGGFLAGRTEIDHYNSERAREVREVETVPEREEEEIYEIFEPYGVTKTSLQPMMYMLKQDKERWVDFMMKFELALEKPDISRSYIAALTIGVSYFIGGLVPLFPYIFMSSTTEALYVSMAVTIAALFIFGYVKSRILGVPAFMGAIQMAVIGACAAGAAFGIARAIPNTQ
ncbi:hypothetical protein SmJEL517_g03256 [Synchytrium microbalum]|uniref:DUF125-domain-containing protein n=1 Tax=Synchytrium microbalum TaxID=1806994 RepID=A0A507C3M5_9FUNG|nr:uncharacterized protein SmJEL517_g03256 [Synchytrium microbalum]TPX34071.1 hypothetical protein SmJEL517_g03256 [Synchytrium microbalum]